MIASLLLAVAVVAGEPGYYTSLAGHIRRWLGQEGVAANVVPPGSLASALAKERFACLVGCSKLTPAQLWTLKSFRARGGKLAVFHSSSAELAALMGVQMLGYRSAPYPGAWSRIDFVSKTPTGLPASVLQTSTALLRAAPIKGRSRTLATWSDRSGRATGEVAFLASDAGWWMTHVLLADGDETAKARLLGAFTAAAAPGAWSLKAHLAREAGKEADLAAYAARQTPRPGEIHAVWDHSGCGLYPGDWPRTVRLLKTSHATDLFVNVAGAGFAHYPSSVLPPSKTLREEGDQLARALAAAKGTGLRIHAWVLCFTGTRGTADRQDEFRKRGWRLKRADGRLTEYLSPANPEVRARMLAAVDEIQSRYPVSGIHLDFVRWGERTVRPRNATDCVTSFVAEARRRVKRPKWLTAAVYGKYPSCIASVGQDWDSWLAAGLVDYVVPMDYTESSAKFGELLAQHAAQPGRARRTIAGIGVTANESRLNARQVIDQANLARRYGLAGVSLFDLDTTLERQILPYLRQGIW